MKQSSLAIAIIAAVVTTIVACLTSAGPLDPPPGPVSSTYKTLTEVEPRTSVQSLPSGPDCQYLISSPGSYYLTANIQGVSGKNGIRIAANNVTLDLSGFALLGVAGSLDGISTESGSANNCIIRNGTANGWGRDGVNVGNVARSVIADLACDGNGRGGITAGTSNTIHHCACGSNGSYGISTYETCTVSACTAIQNGGEGIRVNHGSVVADCTSGFNSGDGFALLSSGGGGTVIRHCTSTRNGGSGINGQAGQVTILDSNCHSNSGDGIIAWYGSTVRSCTCSGNTGHGVSLGSDSQAASNTCAGNGNAGIYANNNDNRIENNLVSDSPFGLLLTSSGNLVIGNSATGNTTNYSISTGNSYATIVDVSGGGGFNITSQYANLAY